MYSSHSPHQDDGQDSPLMKSTIYEIKYEIQFYEV